MPVLHEGTLSTQRVPEDEQLLSCALEPSHAAWLAKHSSPAPLGWATDVTALSAAVTSQVKPDCAAAPEAQYSGRLVQAPGQEPLA